MFWNWFFNVTIVLFLKSMSGKICIYVDAFLEPVNPQTIWSVYLINLLTADYWFTGPWLVLRCTCLLLLTARHLNLPSFLLLHLYHWSYCKSLYKFSNVDCNKFHLIKVLLLSILSIHFIFTSDENLDCKLDFT